MVQPAGPSTGLVALAVAFKTDPGLAPDKQVNEDACLEASLPAGHLLLVCDGMGGHASGREASQLAVATILREMQQPSALLPGIALQHAIAVAGRAVFNLGGPAQNRLRPGSTCVALLVHAAGTEVAHVGDSRAYMIRDGQIYALTKDHSMVQQMVDAGVLTAEEAAVHPDANKITRALGMAAEVEVELRPAPVGHAPGDVYLLATDGLCDLVSPQEMLSVASKALSVRGLAFACEQLVALANSRGGHDNITVLMAQVTEPAHEDMARPTIPEAVAANALPIAPPTLPEMATIPEGAPAGMVQGPAPTQLQRHPIPGVPTPMAAPSPLALGGPAKLPGPAPTMVDDDIPQQAMMPSGTHQAPSGGWQQASAGRGGNESPSASRHTAPLVLGLVLLGAGIVLIALSVWWALSRGSDPPQELEQPVSTSTAAPSSSSAAVSDETAPAAVPSASAWLRRKGRR